MNEISKLREKINGSACLGNGHVTLDPDFCVFLLLEIDELENKNQSLEHCPKCGTTELLCGYNGPGCTSQGREL